MGNIKHSESAEQGAEPTMSTAADYETQHARPIVAALEAEVESLRQQLAGAVEAFALERQDVLNCVNLYGDETLHKALDSIGWPDDYIGGQ